MKTPFNAAPLLMIALLVNVGCWAQQLVQVPRSDGAQTPLRIYSPNISGCAPLALISPGAGGSEDGYKFLAKALQEDGWRAIVIGHKESGMGALRADMRESHGLKKGLRELVNDPAAYDARMMDISATLDWAIKSCKAPFVALLGHSMGARTVMVEAGAKNKLGVKGHDRFDAYVPCHLMDPTRCFQKTRGMGSKSLC